MWRQGPGKVQRTQEGAGTIGQVFSRLRHHLEMWGSKSVTFSGVIQETGVCIQVPFRAMGYTADSHPSWRSATEILQPAGVIMGQKAHELHEPFKFIVRGSSCSMHRVLCTRYLCHKT